MSTIFDLTSLWLQRSFALVSRLNLLSSSYVVRSLLVFLSLVGVFFIFFKFQPDVSIAVVQHRESPLNSYNEFHRELLIPEAGVHYARFAANRIVYHGAKAIESIIGIPGDPRFHPLRLAATLLACGSVVLALLPLWNQRKVQVEVELSIIGITLVSLLSLYAYMPYDLPSLALLSLFLFSLMEERPGLGLAALLVLGVFRETGLHALLWSACYMVAFRKPAHLRWLLIYAATYFLEYKLIRGLLGVPSVSVSVRPEAIFSPTVLASVAVVLALMLLSLAGLLQRARVKGFDAFEAFWMLQVLMVIPWLIFYHLVGGNLSEFRMLIPVVLPLIFAMTAGLERPSFRPATESHSP